MHGEIYAPLMFFCVLLLIFTGYPVAFSLGGVSLVFAGVGVLLGHFDWPLMYAVPERVFGIMANSILLAVPFFIFMGAMLEKSRLAEALLETIGMLFGPIRGGLALGVVVVGTLLAAATGVVGASVVAMGTISLPVMLRHGYSRRLAGGVIAASGTLGQIIPPSVVLIVLADQMGVSLGDLFLGALVPGLLLTGLYVLYIGALSFIDPKVAPALPKEKRPRTKSALFRRILMVMLPPLLLIAVVLGSIFAGLATPTEAGALGALGAVILAAFHRRLNRTTLWETMRNTMHLTSMVMFLLMGSTSFSLVFRGFSGDMWIEDLLSNLPGGTLGLLLVSNLTVFILGFFIDFFEIAFIILPLVIPAARSAGIDMIWFAIVLAMNIQTSFLTPPFGFALFYLRGVAPPEVETTDIYRGALPFIALQVLALLLVIVFPELVLRSP